ncbi:MAG: hypothetical protein IKB70_07570 [Bacilli bacterium]|jgi:hypothetical protein|nr:hypothetical protein [Bacilli bacterium]
MYYNDVYYQVHTKEGKIFEPQFKYEQNAILFNKFLSNRDNEKYLVKKIYCVTGLPEFQDSIILEKLREIGYEN